MEYLNAIINIINPNIIFILFIHIPAFGILSKKFPNIKVYNMGNPGNNNSLIVRSIIYKVKELLKQGIDPKEIFNT